MIDQLNLLNKSQKIWYAYLVIAAILADDEISISEVEYLKQVIGIVAEPAERARLVKCIETKKTPALTPPDNIPKEILTAIYIELILIMISDYDYAAKEKLFLTEIAQLFNFADNFTHELLQWCEDGIAWKHEQKNLVSSELNKVNIKVPLNKLNSEQKKWYAKVLINTILLDRMVDQMEISFLKMAISFLDSKKDQQELMAYVKNKMAPPLSNPPNIPEDILTMIFIEVMLIISADEAVTPKEVTHLKYFADLCNYQKDKFDQLLNWCLKGIQWKQNKSFLFNKCQLKVDPRLAYNKGIVEDNKENNAIQNRQYHCFVCESEQPVPAFQLKQKSQKITKNIFGISTYIQSNQGFDYINFNLIKVILCPHCYFASIQKDYFKKTPAEKPPALLDNKAFKNLWMKGISKRKQRFIGSEDDIFGLHPSANNVIQKYKTALETVNCILKFQETGDLLWQAVLLQLTQAELAMSMGTKNVAEAELDKILEITDSMFGSTKENIISYKCARVQFFISLYRKDYKKAAHFIDFFIKTIKEDKKRISKNELSLVSKIYSELKKAFADRAQYSDKVLDGFHFRT